MIATESRVEYPVLRKMLARCARAVPGETRIKKAISAELSDFSSRASIRSTSRLLSLKEYAASITKGRPIRQIIEDDFSTFTDLVFLVSGIKKIIPEADRGDKDYEIIVT